METSHLAHWEAVAGPHLTPFTVIYRQPPADFDKCEVNNMSYGSRRASSASTWGRKKLADSFAPSAQKRAAL